MSNFMRDHFFDEMKSFLFQFSSTKLATFGFDYFKPVASIMLLLEGIFSFAGKELFIFTDHENRHHLL